MRDAPLRLRQLLLQLNGLIELFVLAKVKDLDQNLREYVSHCGLSTLDCLNILTLGKRFATPVMQPTPPAISAETSKSLDPANVAK